MSLILGIESSCDECSASVVSFDDNLSNPSFTVESVATFSQTDLHAPFGGIVPEVASRNHLETVNHMVDQAMKSSGRSFGDIDAIAVTNRPGLVGALLVGVSAAKAIAYALRKPLVPVHHLEGHLASIFLDRNRDSQKAQYPHLAAVVSGGHTNLYVIQSAPEDWKEDLLKSSLVATSRDDAAGEAFDKTAKTLGFPYPGGVWIDRMSDGGDRDGFQFPRGLNKNGVLDFSFSGLKTAVAMEAKSLEKLGELDAAIPHLCASIQEAIVDSLVTKMKLAVSKYSCRSLSIVGGVAANRRLRFRVEHEVKIPVLYPKLEYCTDNAAMIAAAGGIRFKQGLALSGDPLLTLNALAAAEC